jgi:hypothetical protein
MLEAPELVRKAGDRAKEKLGTTVRALARQAKVPENETKMLSFMASRGISVFVYVRRVTGFNLWLLYTTTEDELTLHAIVDRLPR